MQSLYKKEFDPIGVYAKRLDDPKQEYPNVNGEDFRVLAKNAFAMAEWHKTYLFLRSQVPTPPTQPDPVLLDIRSVILAFSK